MVVLRTFETLEIEEWNQLKDMPIRVVRQKGWNGLVRGIGHYLKDKWFVFADEIKKEVKDF